MSKLFGCTYPLYVAWRVELAGKNDAYQVFGKKTAQRIRSACTRLETTNWAFSIDDVDEAYIDRFLPLYHANIATKDNPQFFNVKEKVLKSPKNTPYQAISLHNGSKYHGGFIFGVREDCLSAAYKVFPKELDIPLPINITFVAEYYFYKYALMQKKAFVYHGLGMNCFGQNASIGLAMFKLQAGALPIVSKQTHNQIIQQFDWDGAADTLIFEGNESQLKKGKLFLTGKNPIEKYSILLNHPELHIETIVGTA